MPEGNRCHHCDGYTKQQKIRNRYWTLGNQPMDKVIKYLFKKANDMCKAQSGRLAASVYLMRMGKL